MLKTERALEPTARIGLLLALALAGGCAQVLNIEDWTEQSAGGGGLGGQSTSVGTGGGSTSTSVGPGGGSTSTSVGPGGGSTSTSVGPGGGSTSTSVGPGGGPTSSSASGTGGQGGGTTDKEVCTNGLDDDNDGAIDCADSDCSAFACVPPVPTGWEGYVAAWVGPSAQSHPDCGVGWTSSNSFYAGTFSAPDSMCGCSCAPSIGGTCLLNLGDDLFTLYNDDFCSAFIANVTPVALDQCKQLSTGAITRASMRFASYTPASGGACASTSMSSKPQATFSEMGYTCENSGNGAGCPNSGVCAPVPTPPFHDTLCIYKHVVDPSTITCPSGFVKTAEVYGDVFDSRDCTACSCGSPVSQSCPMTGYVYTDANCTNLVTSLPGLGTCAKTPLPPQTATYYKVGMGAPGGGICAPSPSMPIGEAKPIDPVVICCRQ